MIKDARELQPEKTSLPSSESELGKLISVRASQEANALSPIDVSDSESLIRVRLLHSEKASGPIVRTESGISTETREEQDWKVE